MIKQIALDGIWKCRHAGGQRGGEVDWPNPQPWMPEYDIRIPGTVQEAMEHLTGDVHRGHNVLNARWIEEETWLLTRTFTLEADALAGGNRIRLVLAGLALYAEVYLNGSHVGGHHNFYTPYRPDITSYVKTGENRLDIRLESGLLANAFKRAGDGHGAPREQAMRRSYCRGPQSSFEWDWSPRLINVGICGGCHLEIGPLFVNEVSVFHELSADYSEAELRIRQFLSLDGEREVCVEAKIAETGEREAWSGCIQGELYVPLTLRISNPKLWQPRNHGEPYRYTLVITVTDSASGEVISRQKKRVGIRRVAIDQSPLKEGGRQFRLLVNGEPLFAKGANMIPLDILYSRFDRASYEVLIDRALEVNFNVLRVWGGGIYETDDFYELCDEKGIVVWQDFIAACANYPADDRDFVENYRAEIAYQLRRMSVYASAVIYCGNNEIDWQMEFPHLLHTYTCASLYYAMVPKIMHAEGDNHYYQPSSPFSPDGMDANSDAAGDQHPWSIGFGDRDYFKYRAMDSRFPNEGGILGPTSLLNMMAALGPGQEFLHSFDFKVHDNAICDQNACAPEKLLEEKLGITLGLGGMSIADYVYYGGFLQGDALTEYILNFRRRMSTTTGSAIFWMYEDCWPATRSWTIVDYLRNRTPSFFPVKRAFAPIAVDIVRAAGGGFDLYGINEYLTQKKVRIRWAAFVPDAQASAQTSAQASAQADAVVWQEAEALLDANSSSVILHIDPPAGTIPCVMLYDRDGTLLARRRFVDRPYHELGLAKPEIRVHLDADGTAVYECDTLAIGVCIDLDGDDKNLSDNFFDLYPGVPHRVQLGGKSGKVLYCLNMA